MNTENFNPADYLIQMNISMCKDLPYEFTRFYPHQSNRQLWHNGKFGYTANKFTHNDSDEVIEC